MGAIADRLAAAKQAAVASSGFDTGMKTAAPAAKLPLKPAVEPRTPSKASLSVLRPEDMIPKKTKPSQVLFKCIKPSLNFVITGVGKPVKRIHFINQYLLTEDTEIIDYIRANAAHFLISEIADKKSE